MDIYKIGIEIALIGSIEKALGSLGGQFLGLHSNVSKINRELRATHEILKGMGTIAFGVGVFAGLKNLVDHGKDYVRIQHNMAEAGASNAEIADATAKSWEATSRYMNVGVGQALEMANNFRGIFGSQDDANSFIQKAAGLTAFMKATKGEAGGDAATSILRQVEAAVKSGEIAGQITPSAMEKHLQSLAALNVAFGDTVSMTAYLTAQRNAGSSYRNFDDEMRYGVFPALVQELGQKAGTQAMTSFQRVGAGTMWRGTAIQQGLDLGLIDPNQVIYNSQGLPTKLQSQHAIKNQGLAVTNPYEWSIQFLGPAVEALAKKQLAQQLRLGNKGDSYNAEVAGIMGRVFQDRSANNFFTELITQESKWAKDVQVVKSAYNSISQKGGFDGYLAGSLDYQEQALGTQWKNLLTSLGSPLVGDAAKGLSVINNAVNALANTFKSHPGAIQAIGEVTAGLAAMATVLGAAKVGKGAFNLLTGGGLAGSAIALDRSAAMLSEAAVALGAKGAVGGIGGSSGKKGFPLLGVAGLLGLMYETMPSAPDTLDQDAWGRPIKGTTNRDRLEGGFVIQPSFTPDYRGFGEGATAPYSGEKLWSLDGNRVTRRRMDPNQISNPTPINLTPQIQATTNVSIDGKALAAYVTQMVIKSIGNLIPHPTGAPMAGTSQFAPAFDSGASH